MMLSEDILFLSPSQNAVRQSENNIGFGFIYMENFSW